MRIVKAAALYFVLVFAAGMVLGPVRELWAVPRFGRVAGLLIEAPLMLAAMTIAARWVLRRMTVPDRQPDRAGVGLVALAILLAAELIVAVARGLSPGDYVAGYTTLPGLISAALYLLFAAMPSLVARRGSDG